MDRRRMVSACLRRSQCVATNLSQADRSPIILSTLQIMIERIVKLIMPCVCRARRNYDKLALRVEERVVISAHPP